MRFKSIATGLAAVVLSTVLVPVAVSTPAVAQTQTSWYVNDNPSLRGPSQYWFPGSAGHGYGSNNYRFTYAIGGDSSYDNWARWDMGNRVGRQEIQVYVPTDDATATVNYNIRIGSNTHKRSAAQRNISGWHSLGSFNTNGSSVVISVYDNDAEEHWERDGYPASRIGVDAIRIRCVSDCASSPPPTTTTTTTTTTTAPTSSSDDAVDDRQRLPGSSLVVNDDPELFGPSQHWYEGYVGKGYGVNNYVYALAVGGDSSPVNWAVWEMGRRAGRQVVEFFIPCGHSNATVTYRMFADGREIVGPRVAQGEECGWVRRGPYDIDGADVKIRLNDSDADEHWERDGRAASRIGVDAIAMRCVLRCGATDGSEFDTGPAPAPAEIRIEARRLTDGRVEFRLDVDGVKWLPRARFLPYDTAPAGTWLRSSPYVSEIRIEARRLTDGRVEFRLDVDGVKWLPHARFLHYDTAPTGAWRRSSPYVLDATSGPSPGDEDRAPSVPAAVVTPTGVPVAVLEKTGGGYLVRTPCGNTAEVSGGTPIGPVRVVLDPGHGGPADPGTVGPNGLVERDLNMALAEATLAELTARGISATLTRTGNYGVARTVRAAFADALGAEALVSMHHNGLESSPKQGEGPGTELYQQSRSAESARLAGVLYEEITEALSTFEGVDWDRLADAGVKRINWPSPKGGDVLGMIRLPVTTTTLIEYGYLTNDSEAALFATPEYITAASKATADGIEAYLNTARPGTGFIQKARVYGFPPRDFGRLRCADTALE